MTDRPLRLLQVGDVAAVAADLTKALESNTDWEVRNLDVPELAAGSHIVLRSAAWPVRAAETWWSIRRQLRASPPSLVHLHWARYAPLVATSDIPLVVHAHGSDVRDRGSTCSGRLVDRRLRRAALVIASTPDLLDHLPPGAVYLPNPIDVDVFGSDGTVEPDPARVLIFAKLTTVKGADVILDAIRTIRRHRPDVSVVGFGGSPRYEATARALGISLLPQMQRPSLAPRTLARNRGHRSTAHRLTRALGTRGDGVRTPSSRWCCCRSVLLDASSRSDEQRHRAGLGMHRSPR